MVHSRRVFVTGARLRLGARKAVELFCRSLPRQRTPSPIDRALDNAVITAPDKRDRGAMARLDAIAGRVISQG